MKNVTADDIDQRPEVRELFRRLKAELASFEKMLTECSDMWGYDDAIYRFYHQSFKVYAVQTSTLRIVERLQVLAPERELNGWFLEIIAAGTGKLFTNDDNRHWLETTRPMVEAFFHARFFLEMAVKCGRELSDPPNLLPSSWAALLHLYNLR